MPRCGGVVAELAVDGVGEGLGVFAEAAALALECAVFGGVAPGLVGEVAAELFGVVAVLFDELEGVAARCSLSVLMRRACSTLMARSRRRWRRYWGSLRMRTAWWRRSRWRPRSWASGAMRIPRRTARLKALARSTGSRGRRCSFSAREREDVAGGVGGVEGGLGGDEDGDVAEVGVDGGLSAAFADDEAELSVGCGLCDDGLEEAVCADGMGEFLGVGEGDVVAGGGLAGGSRSWGGR